MGKYFSHSSVFPIIQRMISERSQDNDDYVTRLELLNGLLEDSESSRIIKLAVENGCKLPPERIAGNMIDWYSKAVTETDLDSAVIVRERINKQWAYKSKNEKPEPIQQTQEILQSQEFNNFAKRIKAIGSRLRQVERKQEQVSSLEIESILEGVGTVESRLDDVQGSIQEKVTELFEEAREVVEANMIVDGQSTIEWTSALEDKTSEIREELVENVRFLRGAIEDLYSSIDRTKNDLQIAMTKRLKEVVSKLEERDARPETFVETEKRILNAQKLGRSLVQQSLSLRMSPSKLVAFLDKQGFILNPTSAREILESLRSRRILVLKGPPGTGKSKLAKLLPDILLRGAGRPPKFTLHTMDPEVESYQMIGGLRMVEGQFGAHLGYLTDAVISSIESRGRHWLVLDEINRGDISECLSAVLDGLNLEVGELTHNSLFPDRTRVAGTIPIPGKFRIIGTMNSFDADQLFRFSEALARRSSFISIEALRPEQESMLADEKVFTPFFKSYAQDGEDMVQFKSRHQLDDAAALIFSKTEEIRSLAKRRPTRIYRYCEVGTSLVFDMIQRVCRAIIEGAEGEEGNVTSVVDSAIETVLLSHLDHRTAELLRTIQEQVFDQIGFPRCWEKLNRQIRSLDAY